MSDDTIQDTVVELRKLRRLIRVLIWLVVVLVVVSAMSIRIPPHRTRTVWDDVNEAMRGLDFPAALSLAQSGVARQPQYYYGHAYLGSVYLAMNDITNAEAEYSKAYQLFPTEENEKTLAAVRKRMTDERTVPLLLR